MSAGLGVGVKSCSALHMVSNPQQKC